MKRIYLLLLTSIFYGFISSDSSANSNDVSDFSLSGQWFLAYQIGERSGADFNEFKLKRGYITIKKSITPAISGRITPDISVDNEGDGKGDIELRLKYCYIKYSLSSFGILQKPYFEFGLVHRPWLDFEEHINRYRVQGTMFLERSGIFNSADYGVTLVADLGGQLSDEYKHNVGSRYLGKYGSIALGIYNGGGYHSIEMNENKTLESRITLRPFFERLPGFQVSYLNAYGKGNVESSPDWLLNAAFVSWEGRQLILTGMFFTGDGNSSGSSLDVNGSPLSQSGYSLFSEIKFHNKKWSLIGRQDYFESNHIELRSWMSGIAYHFYQGCKAVIDFDYQQSNQSGVSDNAVFEFAVEVGY